MGSVDGKMCSFTAYSGPGQRASVKEDTRHCKECDRFELQFDFVAHHAIFFFNGRRLGFLTRSLPRALYPALSMYGLGDSVKITKFKVDYK